MKQNAIIFGVGRNYKVLYKYICAEYDIIALSDNDNSKWHKTDTISGKTIIPPSEIKHIIEKFTNEGGCKILITPRFSNDIILQLLAKFPLISVYVCRIDYNRQSCNLAEFYMDNDVLISCFNTIKVENDLSAVSWIEVFWGEAYKIEYPFFEHNNTIAIDIGMNVGCASLYFANMENVEKIYSFEPFTENYTDALRNFELNQAISHKIIPHNFGLGNGNHVLSVSNNIACRKIGDGATQIAIKYAAEVLSPIIDEYWKKRKIWFKCDCEGGEYDIFESLDKAGLFSKIDIITMEWHGYKLDFLKKMLLKNHFAFYVIDNMGIGMIYAFKLEGG